MVYIYADESGCLGFDFAKSGTRKHMLITFLMLTECRPIISLVKKVILTLPKLRRKKGAYLHAHYEKPITIKRLLINLATKDVKIATILLDKHKVLLPSDPNVLYSSMVATLINRLYTEGIIKESDELTFIASRRNTSEKLNDEFTKSIERFRNNDYFRSCILPARDDKCLQAVDFVSWAMWQKYDNNDETYSDIIADKIIKEYTMDV